MRAAALATLLLAACVPEEGPSMKPGEDCLGCHGGGEEDARPWTVAGTWSRGAHVSITDSAGKSFTIRGNEVGNFYTAEGLAFPLTVAVDGNVMSQNGTVIPVTYGGCNRCHGGGGDGGGGGG